MLDIGAHRRIAVWTGILALLVVVAAFAPDASGKPPAGGTKTYAAAGPTGVVPLPVAPATSSFDLVLRNTTPQQSFASAEIRVTDGRLDPPTATAPGSSPWTVTSTTVGADDVYLLTAGSAAAVFPGESLTVTFPVTASTPTGSVQLRTRVKQSNDFSGEGNDFNSSTANVTVLIGHGPAAALAWVQQPTTIQVTGSEVVASGYSPRLVMCAAPQVRIVDSAGRTVTDGALDGTTVSLTDAGNALAAAGLTATTTAGVATFGDAGCTTGITGRAVGTGLTTTASAGSLTSPASSTFDVRKVWGTCTGSTCSVSGLAGPAKTTAGVHGSGKQGTGGEQLVFDLAASTTWQAAFGGACDPDPGTGDAVNGFRDVTTVELGGYDKVVELRWSKAAVQWATNNGAKQWDVCFAALYPFQAAGGVPTGLVHEGQTWYVGALQPCAAVASDQPCLLSLGRNAGQQTASVRIPFNPLDPRMI